MSLKRRLDAIRQRINAGTVADRLRHAVVIYDAKIGPEPAIRKLEEGGEAPSVVILIPDNGRGDRPDASMQT